MRTVRTRLLSIAALGVLTALAAGCQRVPTDEGGPAPPVPQTVELTLFTWVRAEENAVNEELLARFEADHPGIKVRIINITHQAMDKLQTMIAGGEAPDVMSIHGAFYTPLAAKGALYDLEQLIGRDPSFDLDDIFPRLVELCRYEGKLYSLPRYTSVYALFYNKRLFDAAGHPYPATGEGEWDWQAFLKAAQATTQDFDGDGKTEWGCVIDFWGARLYPWLWQNGADLMNEERTECILDRPEAIRALQFLWDLRHTWGVTPQTLPAERGMSLQMFMQGKAAMFMSGPWDVQDLKATEGLEWDVAPLPHKKRRATMLGAENYAIAADTKHPQEAWELFKFLLSPYAQTVMAEKREKMPSRVSVATGPYLEAEVGYDRRPFVEAVEYAAMPPNLPEWDKIRHLIRAEMDLAWIGKMPVAEACRRATRSVNQALAKERGS